MTRRELIDYCLTFPDACEDYPFDPLPGDPSAWTVMRSRSNKKGFAFIFERGGLCVNLKCAPAYSGLLRRSFESVAPAYHMNKERWNTVRPGGDLPEEELLELIGLSYRLTMRSGSSRRPSDTPVRSTPPLSP